jgi:hypothetical protein
MTDYRRNFIAGAASSSPQSGGATVAAADLTYRRTAQCASIHRRSKCEMPPAKQRAAPIHLKGFCTGG